MSEIYAILQSLIGLGIITVVIFMFVHGLDHYKE